MKWLILEQRTGLFWRENSAGYGALENAGLYTEEEAKKLSSNKERMDKAIPLEHYRAGITRLYEALDK